MIELSQVEELKKLIKRGFDIELMSFELDIPMEELKQIQNEINKEERILKSEEKEELESLIKRFDIELISLELNIPLDTLRQLENELKNNETKRNVDSGKIEEKEQSKNPINEDVINLSQSKRNVNKKSEQKNLQAHYKLEQMRGKYRKLYYASNQSDYVKEKELSRQEIELINSTIMVVEEAINKIKETSEKEKRKEEFERILKEVEKIQNHQLNLDQAEKLNMLLREKELEYVRIKKMSRIQLVLTRSTVLKRLIEAIDIAQSKTQDIEELKYLKNKLISNTNGQKPIIFEGLKIRIDSKISKLQQKDAIYRIRNDIPENILEIISGLSNGTLEIQKAKNIIEEEAKRRVKNSPQTKFSLTEEQQKEQILVQIRIAIEERADKYHLRNPEETVLNLYKLCDGSMEQAAITVIDNLVNCKDFKTSKDIYNKFFIKGKHGDISPNARWVRQKIRNAEISDIVLKAINMNGTMEEEGAYFNLIETGLKMGNVDTSAISLGKSQDGLRNITLADIWIDEYKKRRVR